MASASDNFNRSNSTGLGANWTAVNNDFNVVSNRAHKQGGVDTSALVVYTATQPATADQRTSATLYTDLTTGYGGLAVRASNSQETCYTLMANSVESYLFRYVNGTPTQLGSIGAGIANGTQIRLEVEGTGATVTLRVYTNSGGGWALFTSLGTSGIYSDDSGSRITSPGYCGVAGYGTTSSNAQVDDWSFEDVAGGSPSPVVKIMQMLH